jgi:GTP-binding protein
MPAPSSSSQKPASNQNKKPVDKAPIIKEARFITSAPSIKAAPETNDQPEIVFVGRSNVGKSSLINSLLGRKNLAKTSNTPGKTRLINFYHINQQFYFVDLPGYGYAKVSHAEQAQWKKALGNYITQRTQIKLVLSLIDARHPPQENDLEMLSWLFHHQLPVEVVMTKSDKLTKNELQKQKKLLSDQLEWSQERLIFYSATSHQGKEALWKRMSEHVPEIYPQADTDLVKPN